MNADQWVITVSSVSAAVFSAIAVVQGRRKERRELERGAVDWDALDMDRPTVVLLNRGEGLAHDVAATAFWEDERSGEIRRHTERRAVVGPGEHIEIPTPGCERPPTGTMPYVAATVVTVEVVWRTPRRTPQHERLVTGWSSPRR